MLKANEQISISGSEVLEVLKEIEIILTSLHKMGSYYSIKYQDGELISDNAEYEKETTRFIDEWKVTYRLAKVRGMLSEKFDKTLGNDDMDDIERAMEMLKYWSKPGDAPDDI
ncbi:hypothetical protein [Paenibacillus aceris]|uniref:Uncharacterized protein n=1 Tax=Paenibacillus aceris TaxID=869555 RepID=A0ABS4I839_9BACL|nr:hypothetical protein [Paenibacillus aceris]MBP1967096.1 hypothetical protein [Paenibacillus aceris]NHW35512.1 hypothetical protein [Paenibacillus aceris]